MLLKFLDDLVDTRKSIPRREADVGQNLYHETGSKKEYQEGLDSWTKNDGTSGMIINLLDIMKDYIDVEGKDLLNMCRMFYKGSSFNALKIFSMIQVTEKKFLRLHCRSILAYICYMHYRDTKILLPLKDAYV